MGIKTSHLFQFEPFHNFCRQCNTQLLLKIWRKYNWQEVLQKKAKKCKQFTSAEMQALLLQTVQTVMTKSQNRNDKALST